MNVEFRFIVGAADWGIKTNVEGLTKFSATNGIIAVDLDTGEIVGACMMDHWTPNSVHAHLTILDSDVMKHGFGECVSNYMFNTRGVARVYGIVPANNEKALQITKYIGFTVKTVLEEAFAVGVDYMFLELTRANCIFVDTATDEKAA
jgi:RimJ/RimL family protein N-acetyltransferase